MYEANRAAPSAYAVYQAASYFGISMERLLTTKNTERMMKFARRLQKN